MYKQNEKSQLPLDNDDGVPNKHDLQATAKFQPQSGYPPTPNHQAYPPPTQQIMTYPPYYTAEGMHQGERAMLGSYQQQSYGTSADSIEPNNPWSHHPNATAPPPLESEEIQPHFDYPKKSLVDAYLLAVVFGLIGAHHFYLRRYVWGFVYLLTFGLFGFGYIIDLFRIPYLVRKYNAEHSSAMALRSKNKNREKNLSDAYVAWFPCGLIGFHHYYLGDLGWGIAYTVTFGLFGIGWIVDGFRMPTLVQKANERIQLEECIGESERKMWVCYALGIPFGFLGFHNFYLKRKVFCVFYFLTFGLLGVGWLVDLFRMPILLRRCNDNIKGVRDSRIKTVDDSYVLWLTFGLIGSHHFYLRRPLWGLVYFFSFGLFGIGWIVDLFRIPSLVKDTNMKLERQSLISEIQDNSSNHIVASNPSGSQYHNSGHINNLMDVNNVNPTMQPYLTAPAIAGPPSYDESSDMDKPPPYQE